MNAAGVYHLDPRTVLVDLHYLGVAEAIACCLLDLGDSVALLDPGPSVSMPVLLARMRCLGLSVADIQFILLTHIHLDHAGATGSLVQQNSHIQVLVESTGAQHMVDPEKLLRSAGRLYGSEMHQRWGEFLAVPSENIRILSGGEQLRLGSRTLDVVATPGHASHHVTYFDPHNGLAFVGDTAGVRISNKTVIPVTPPPDIDLRLWNRSLDEIEKRRPEHLFLTHFGVADQVDWHIEELRKHLSKWGSLVRDSLQDGADDVRRAARFAGSVVSELKGTLSDDYVLRYENSSSPGLSWHGLARYWRKHPELCR